MRPTASQLLLLYVIVAPMVLLWALAGSGNADAADAPGSSLSASEVCEMVVAMVDLTPVP
jgi:hypothetical protein